MTVEQLAVNTIKGLAMDAVQRANSGHPGMPMGMADIAVVLWSRFLNVDPDVTDWPDRDRFVLSNGHGSMLLYSLLHLCGFPLALEELKRFRQWGSLAPGHPEINHDLGIEMTTGPLGQGFATGVGMAIAEANLRARFGAELVDHRTFGFVSDGDLMEGLSYEAASIAGHLGLGRLIYLYDDNSISIDGPTSITFREDVSKRFEAAGWHIQEVDGHDREAIGDSISEALSVEDRPSLIRCKTVIAHGSPKLEGTSKSHGAPLGLEEVAASKEAMGFSPDMEFHIPEGIREFFAQSMERGRSRRLQWLQRWEKAMRDGPLAEEWKVRFSPEEIHLQGPGFKVGDQIATRAASGKLFTEIAEKVPGLIGGAADLAESTKTVIDKGRLVSAIDPSARDIAFGIREHAMGAIVNGLGIHGGFKPYGSTFFVFSDYMRPAVRIGALMGVPAVWVWTHDSFYLGEDGPTHQPIEHLGSLRAMPNLWVIRPADANETIGAWEVALNREDGPVALVLTRQNLPVLDVDSEKVASGGYVVREGMDVVLVATGSEVSLALSAADLLEKSGVQARVVSMPCWELFFEQPPVYRDQVLGVGIPRVSIEAASTFGWDRIVGENGLCIGVDHFGASAPAEVLAEEYGFTPEKVAERVRELINP